MKFLLPILLVPAVVLAQPASLSPAAQARDQRASLLQDEIKALDSRIESRIDRIIAGLADIADTKDSKTKVARLKEQTIESLRKNLGYYQQKRAAILEEIRQPRTNLTADQKQKVLAALDARVQKRVQEILTLEKSFPQSKEYDRYQATGGGYWGTEYQRNADFEQNRRLSAHTDQMRGQVLDGLKKSIARLEQQQRTLQALPPSDATKTELARNNALLKERRAQVVEVLKDAPDPTRKVSLKQAMDLDAALRQASDELRRDFTTLFGRYHDYLAALSDLNTARAASRTVGR